MARARGQKIPFGWLLDKDGKPTDDPNAQEDGGVMLPLGGPEGHKGYGLSFAVESLASILPWARVTASTKGRHNDGIFMLVVDPAAFSPATSRSRWTASSSTSRRPSRPRASKRCTTRRAGAHQGQAARRRGHPDRRPHLGPPERDRRAFGVKDMLTATEAVRSAGVRAPVGRAA